MLSAVPRSARLSATQRFTVVSYNLLAPIYVRPIDERTGTVQAFAAFAWCDDEALSWELRQPRMLAALRTSEADVICLQEVQFEAVANADEETFGLPAWLHLDGYHAVIPSQRPLREMAVRNERVLRQRAPVGNALLYRLDRLEAVDDTDSAPSSGAPAKAPEQGTTRVGVCVRGKAGSGLEALGRLAVFSVHLDATAEDKRVKALAKCVEAAKSSYGTRSVLIAGDMNTELLRGAPTSAMLACRADGGDEGEPSDAELEQECARALRISDDEGPAEEDDETTAALAISEPEISGAGGDDGGRASAGPRPTAEQLASWRALYAMARAVPSQTRIALHRVPTGSTRAAYAPGQTSGACLGWALDHVLYTPRALRLAAHWQTLEAHPDALAAGLPTVAWPSDHMAIGASFDPMEVATLDRAATDALLASVERLFAAQAHERAELSAVITAEVGELEANEKAKAAEAAAAAAASATAAGEMDVVPAANKKSKKEGKKNKGGPPSMAMQDMLRSKRERERNLKVAQKSAREGMFETLSEPQRDALEAAHIDLANE